MCDGGPQLPAREVKCLSANTVVGHRTNAYVKVNINPQLAENLKLFFWQLFLSFRVIFRFHLTLQDSFYRL